MSEVKRWNVESDEQDGPCSLWNVESAEGEFVEYEDYAALKAEREALAVECAQYKSLAERFAERADDYKSGHFGYSVFDSSNEFKQHIKTPATDAYLNSVRADAIFEAASLIAAQIWEEDEGQGMVAAIDALAIIEQKVRAGEPL